MITTYGPFYRRDVLQMKETEGAMKKVPKLELAPLNGKCYSDLIEYYSKVIKKFEIGQ